jgi:outer membrane receptor protein involved in Fe transport
MAAIVIAVVAAWPVAGWSQIEEIVVTTRKKEESLQDVPIAVSAITEEQISRQGVADLNDVVKSSPSVQFDRSFGPSDTRITIRGLSNTRGRSNVAFLVDGIDVTTENLIVAGSGLLANRRLLTDVQRIEIVKGPQSALYGRAAFAGAINYITKEPGDLFEGTTRVDFADDGFQQVDAAFGGPVLGDTLGVRVTGFWYNQDGHYVNAMSGEDVGGSGGSGAALTTVIRPNDITKIKLRGEFSREDYDPLPNVRMGGTWQDAPGVSLFEYPEALLENARNRINGLVGINALGASASLDSTGLLDFNQYCPDGNEPGERDLRDPSKGPGICLPTTFGEGSGRVVRHSEDPLTGHDFDGTDLETFRLSSIATFDMEGGVLTSYTGWTNFDGHDQYDQDWQAQADYKFTPPGGTQASYLDSPSPDFYNGRRADQLTSAQWANTDSEVEQFSQELRFASKLDGPVQYTLGALFWDEVRQLYDRNGLALCMPIDKVGSLSLDGDGNFVFPQFFYQDGNAANGGNHNSGGSVCDGDPGQRPGTSSLFPTVIGWQEFYRQLQPQAPSYWRADTRHWSFYTNLSWEIAESWTIEFEERFVSEDFRLQKPNQSTCTTLGYIGVIGQSFQLEDDAFDAVCAYQEITTPASSDSILNDGAITNSDSIRPLQASQTSHFNTPKVTLNWKPTPDSLVYFFWARAQKPGGINQLAGGGSPVFRKTEAFLPEKLEAWELGTKNTFDVGGALLANASFFFQDYTDKQTNTQVIDASGVSQPRTLNASGAEIWGAELEFTWAPDLLEGLLFSVAYTYLDAEYTKFIDDVTSVQRIAALGDCTLVYKNAAGEEVQAGAVPAGEIISAACRADLGGNRLERTPEHAVALSASYTRPLLDTGLDLLAEVGANWQDKRYVDPDNAQYFDSYWNVDTRIGVTHPQYEIIAYVDNLFDDDTIRSGGSGPDFARQVAETGFTAGLGVSHFFGTLPDPRIFGVRATYRFGGD